MLVFNVLSFSAKNIHRFNRVQMEIFKRIGRNISLSGEHYIKGGSLIYAILLVPSKHSSKEIFEGLQILLGGENQEFLQNIQWQPLSKPFT